MAKRLRVYVAGPYSADNVLGVLQNIGRGEWHANSLFQQGFAPFCPWHDKGYAEGLWDTALSVDDFREHSLAWLEASQAVFVIPGWEESNGTKAEIARAEQLGIPVFYEKDDLYRWRWDMNKEQAS